MKKPNKYQLEIYREYNSTSNNIFIEAGPGSGKTTTILKLLEQTPFYKKSIFLAFNKSIAEEIKNRVSGKSEVSTIHSIGYRLLLKHSHCKLTLNENKTFLLGKKFFNKEFLKTKFTTEKKINFYLFSVQEMYHKYRMNICENISDLKVILVKYSFEHTDDDLPELMSFFKKINKYNLSEESNLMIDYTDMVYLPLIKVSKGSYPSYDIVFIDEVQDLNPLQNKFINKLIGSSGRFIAVGDSKQSIYSFMGSNLDSFNAFRNKKNTTVLPLTVSYRCPKSIIELANQIFPGMESYEENIDGVIRYGELKEVEPGDFVICRNNLPLIESYVELLKSGKKVKILGKDLGVNLLKMIESVNDITELDAMLLTKMKALESKGVKNIQYNAPFQELTEKVNILKYLYSNSNKSISRTINLLKNIFSEQFDKKDITLMTSHKSKGLETDRVFYLQPSLIPSKYAITEMDLYQEKCLEYVIITRTKKELIIIN